MLLRRASLSQIGVGFRLGKDLPFNGEVFFAFKLPDVLVTVPLRYTLTAQTRIIRTYALLFLRVLLLNNTWCFLNVTLNSVAVRPTYVSVLLADVTWAW